MTGIAEKNVTVSGGITRVPGHLQITPTMVDDFLCDPVLAVYVIFGIKLDVFQAVRLRLMWWTPNVIDSSGFGTGKSLGIWLWMNLRALMIGDQHLCVYYQTFQAAKDIFWPYYRTFHRRRSPIFDAQLGRVDSEGDTEGKDNTMGPACLKQYFKNESLIMAPAPNWFQDAKGQAGQTFNGVGIDEWTKVETMVKKGSQVKNEKGESVGGINQQIIGRVRRSSWNQFHPLWGNHMVFMATAESLSHPGYRRYKNFLSSIQAGDTDYGVFSSCFKDFSNQLEETDIRIEDVTNAEGRVVGRELKSTKGKPIREVVPNWKRIAGMKTEFTRAHFLREVLGIWARETKGLYPEANVERCVAQGLAANLQPETSRNNHLGDNVHYFLGYDPAPARTKGSDDAGLAVLRARPRPGLANGPTSNAADWLCEYVWAYRMRGEIKRKDTEGVLFASTTGQMSGRVHQVHRQFALTGILMDPAGGGNLVLPELNKTVQNVNGTPTECTPIALPDDATVANAHFILNLMLRKDPGIEMLWPLLVGDDGLYDAMHQMFEEAVEHCYVSFPVPFNERPGDTTKDWTPEMRWALINLDEARRQLLNLHVVTNDSGVEARTKNGSRQFTAVGKKDLAYGCMMAYVRFRMWLVVGTFDEEDAGETGIYSVG